MNYISTNHRGGLGNVMFKLASTIGVALDNDVEYLFSNEFLRPIDRIVTLGFDDYRIYYDNILRNVSFITELPKPYITYAEDHFHYKPIPYQPGTNLLLEGGFQSEKYFVNHKQTILDIFKPTDEIKQLILSNYADINQYVSIHVRRGDYLQFPNHHPQQTIEYYQSAVELIGIDKTYIIFSDDVEGCKSLFDFIPNKFFFNSGTDWLDMYIMSMCEHNIICNSTFSWWAAYLNSNDNKIVVAPKRWFGSVYASWDTSDLIPSEWTIIDK
jgi:hypothetical protein